MKKVVVNHCYGGYGWSNKAVLEYLKRMGCNPADLSERDGKVFIGNNFFYNDGIQRTDPVAIEILEEKGTAFCSGPYSELAIEEYNDEFFDYSIDEYDGCESLNLIPTLSEDRVRSCSSIDEVVDLLRKCNVIR